MNDIIDLWLLMDQAHVELGPDYDPDLVVLQLDAHLRLCFNFPVKGN